jgi:dihydroflavonol-4-reductase
VKALVTGAAGFIGAHVVAALCAAGADVRGFDRREAGAFAGSDFVIGDILDREALARALDGRDAVFHLAALYSYRRSDAAAMQAVNVEGTRALLDAALRGSARRRVVHTSSCATCGPVPGRAATEDDQPARWELRVPYKRTKLEGEVLAQRAAAAGGDVVIVNPTTPVGPGDLRPTPTGKMVADVASGRARGYLARGALNIVDVADIAGGHLLAFEHGSAGRRYLLGGENMAIADVFAVIARTVGRSAPHVAVPWTLAYAAGRAADAALRAVKREPALLNLDEIRVARWPMLFDDARARRELGYSSKPAAGALSAAALASITPAALPAPSRP